MANMGRLLSDFHHQHDILRPIAITMRNDAPFIQPRLSDIANRRLRRFETESRNAQNKSYHPVQGSVFHKDLQRRWSGF
jgi:hypothetical protein